MTKAILWADWAMNVIAGALIFVGGSCIVAPDFVYDLTAPKVVRELKADLERPAISDEAWAAVDKRVFQ